MARLTKQIVIDALTQYQGNVSDTAKSLDCSRQTVYNYIDRYDDVKQAFDDISEATIDKVESKMFDLIDEGNATLIIFYLKTKAKHRGYIERREVTGRDGQPMEHKVTMLSELSDAELDDILDD